MVVSTIHRQNGLFTSESVSAGHPDKLCDQVSDAIVDAILGKDAQARTAIETAVTTDRLILLGEYRTAHAWRSDEFESIARTTVKNVGYDQEKFSYRRLQFASYLHEQSTDIAQGVDAGNRASEGAGDQGIMFGFACNETPSFMPAPITYAHAALKALADHRKNHPDSVLLPDAKSQVTLNFVDGRPVELHTLVVSSQHSEHAKESQVHDEVTMAVRSAFPPELLTSKTRILINPTGRFVIGGPDGDAGLTGRKVVVDTYGGSAPHGGGAFSGKDPTKVDRSAAYAARYLARNVVEAGLADRCLIQLSYAIGRVEPMSVFVTTDGTGKIPDLELTKLVMRNFDLTPRGILDSLNLCRPIYLPTATFGHFGRSPSPDGHFSWEHNHLVSVLQREA